MTCPPGSDKERCSTHGSDHILKEDNARSMRRFDGDCVAYKPHIFVCFKQIVSHFVASNHPAPSSPFAGVEHVNTPMRGGHTRAETPADGALLCPLTDHPPVRGPECRLWMFMNCFFFAVVVFIFLIFTFFVFCFTEIRVRLHLPAVL